MSQEEFSKKIGVSRVMYSSIELGRRHGGLSFWTMFQKAFSVPDCDMWNLIKIERGD